jgi:hypothetical protein
LFFDKLVSDQDGILTAVAEKRLTGESWLAVDWWASSKKPLLSSADGVEFAQADLALSGQKKIERINRYQFDW